MSPFGHSSADHGNATSRTCSETFANLRIIVYKVVPRDLTAVEQPLRSDVRSFVKCFRAHAVSWNRTPMCFGHNPPEEQNTAKLHGLVQRLGIFSAWELE